MARTINEIQQVILAEKASHEELDVLDSTSKVSIWRLWTYITAFVIWSLEMIFDTHRAEVSSMIAELKPHTARWYRNKALAFQFGFALLPDSDIFDNENHSEEEIEASKIVKYSSVTESESSRLIIKIAGETSGVLSPIDEEQQEAFEKYIKEIRDAGVPVTVINYLPDLLYLNIRIKRNPLVLDRQGNAIVPINGILRPVDDAIAVFLRQLPFNGELVLSRLTDILQTANGVDDVQIDEASTSWLDPIVNDYGITKSINMSKIPVSGYFTTKDREENDLVKITYI